MDKKLKEFYDNVTEQDIYPVEEDPKGRTQGQEMINLLKRAEMKLTESDVNNGNVLHKAIRKEPQLIIALRSLIGEHETTFRLILSTMLYKTRKICGCTKIPIIHTEKSLLRMASINPQIRKVFVDYFVEQKLPLIFQALMSLSQKEQAAFIRLIAQYQVKQRLAKLRGHKAEQIIAMHLDRHKIPFEPREKLTILGSRDVKIDFLDQRECDIAIPNGKNPRVVIQSSFYQSITGSIASKTVRETRETKNAVDLYNQKNPIHKVEFWLLIDGVGWLGMSSILQHIINIPDNFFEFKTIENKLIPRLKKLGL